MSLDYLELVVQDCKEALKTNTQPKNQNQYKIHWWEYVKMTQKPNKSGPNNQS